MDGQREFFNSVAYKWDTMCYHDRDKINRILDIAGIKDDMYILDVACGTGILAPFLYDRNKKGSITCVDISENMIEVAKGKYNYSNVEFIVSDIMEFKSPHKYDAIMLYSCFPHFSDKEALIKRMYNLLNEGAKMCICHSQSREAINNLHESRAEVSEDRLPKASYTANIMVDAGLEVITTIDDEDMYVVLGMKEKAE